MRGWGRSVDTLEEQQIKDYRGDDPDPQRGSLTSVSAFTKTAENGNVPGWSAVGYWCLEHLCAGLLVMGPAKETKGLPPLI